MKLITKKTMLMQLTITTEATSKIIKEAINKIPAVGMDTYLLEEDTGDLKTPQIIATKVHQLTKAKVHIEETVAIKIKAAEEAKLMVTQAETILNIANNLATQWKTAAKYKQKKQQSTL
jgi:hypothetical protein